LEMFCTTVVPAPKGHLGGASLKYFCMIHKGRRYTTKAEIPSKKPEFPILYKLRFTGLF